MKARYVAMVVALVAALALGACSKAEPTPEPGAVVPEGDFAGPRGGLQGTTRLALGTFRLEETEHAVTPEQAAAMLPLWKAIQSGSLQGAAETEAVLKQIEGVMDGGQLAAIDEMALSFEDVGAWMESPSAKALGIELPTPPAGQRPGDAAFQNVSEEERQKLRQEMENLSPEQRATRLAEMGMERPQGGGPGVGPGGTGGGPGGRPAGFVGRGGGNFLVDPLVELLSERARE